MQTLRVDIRGSPNAERLICQQIHGCAVFVACPGEDKLIQLNCRDGNFLLTHLIPRTSTQKECTGCGGYAECRSQVPCCRTDCSLHSSLLVSSAFLLALVSFPELRRGCEKNMNIYRHRCDKLIQNIINTVSQINAHKRTQISPGDTITWGRR